MKTTVITGGIASGKSQVATIIKGKGYPVLDADQVSRQVVEPGTEGLHKVVSQFGDEFLLEDGRLDRRKLRIHIATDAHAQRTLSAILFPLIRKEIESQLSNLEREGATHSFVEAALAIEAGSYKMYDSVMLVTAPANLRLARLLQRDGMEQDHAKGIMAKQMPDSEKEKFADVILVNDTDLDDLKRQIDRWLLGCET